jgi:hypothetical protein
MENKMKFKKYIPLLIATPFVLASCAAYIDISSQMSDDAAGALVHFNVVPPQGFITAPTTNAATIINYTASLSSTGATTCNVIIYGLDGLDGTSTTVTFANGKASLAGTTFASGVVEGNFLEIEGCSGAGTVSSSVDISFTVGVDTYNGSHAAGTITSAA